MKAVLKTIGNDVCDLDLYCPDDVDKFNMLLTLTIGSDDGLGGDFFQVNVCTPEWLCDNSWEPALVRHVLLVRTYSLDEIKKTITDYIDDCEGDDWGEIAQKLSRVFAWEYEDYQS